MSRFSLKREGTRGKVTMGYEPTVSFIPELRELQALLFSLLETLRLEKRLNTKMG